MIFVPVASIAHLLLNFSIMFGKDAGANLITSWLIIYPAMGALNIIYYSLILHPTVSHNIKQVKGYDLNKERKKNVFAASNIKFLDEEDVIDSVGVFISKKSRFNAINADGRGIREFTTAPEGKFPELTGQELLALNHLAQGKATQTTDVQIGGSRYDLVTANNLSIEKGCTVLRRSQEQEGGIVVAEDRNVMVVTYFNESENEAEVVRIVGQQMKTIRDLNTSKTYFQKEKDRKDGTGEFRVGTPMELGFDLYSMMYVTMLFPEYVYLFEKIHKKEEETLEKLIKEEEQSQGDVTMGTAYPDENANFAPQLKDKEMGEEIPQEVRDCLARLGVPVDDKLAESLGSNWRALVSKAEQQRSKEEERSNVAINEPKIEPLSPEFESKAQEKPVTESEYNEFTEKAE